MLVPGQIASLRTRLGLLAPDHERLSARLEKLVQEEAALVKAGADEPTVTRVARQAKRITAELAEVTGEMTTLQGLIDARISTAPGSHSARG